MIPCRLFLDTVDFIPNGEAVVAHHAWTQVGAVPSEIRGKVYKRADAETRGTLLRPRPGRSPGPKRKGEMLYHSCIF